LADGRNRICEKLREELRIGNAKHRDPEGERQQAELGSANAMLDPAGLAARLIAGDWRQARKQSKHSQAQVLSNVCSGFKYLFIGGCAGTDERSDYHCEQATPENGGTERAVAEAGRLDSKGGGSIGDCLV
jgi:hypothetical protein